MRGIELLGMKVTDKVTGFKGVVTSMCYDLYGCVQAVVSPPLGKDGKKEPGLWFDMHRLKVTGKKAVMAVPDFGVVKGPAEKPSRGAYGTD